MSLRVLNLEEEQANEQLHQHNERLYTMICIEGQCSYMLICCVKVIRLVIRSFYNHH